MNVIFDLLPVLVALLSVSAVVASVMQLVLRHRAEIHMQDLIRVNDKLKRLRAQIERARNSGQIDASKYAEVSATLEQLAKQLKAHERAVVLRSLRQPSIAGRQRYVGKLLSVA